MLNNSLKISANFQKKNIIMLVFSVKRHKIDIKVKKVIDMEAVRCYNVYIEQRSS